MKKRRRRGPDAYELGAARMRAELDPYEPLPDELRRFDFRRLMFVVLAVVVVLAIVRSGGGHGVPAVDGSCSKPAFAFDHESTRVGQLVTWSVAGPTGAQAVITADSASPTAGRVQEPVVLKDCKATGRFRVSLTQGHHVLRVFLRDPDGSSRLLGSQPLEVDAPR